MNTDLKPCLSLGLHKGRPSYRRNLQPSKDENSDPDPQFVCGSGSAKINADPCGSGSETLGIAKKD
jgi:hypothetical protein